MDSLIESENVCRHCNQPVKWYTITKASVGIVLTENYAMEYHRAEILQKSNSLIQVGICCPLCNEDNEFTYPML